MSPAAQKSTNWLREWWPVIVAVLAVVYATGQLTVRVGALETTLGQAVASGNKLAEQMNALEREMVRVRTILERRERSQPGATPPGD